MIWQMKVLLFIQSVPLFTKRDPGVCVCVCAHTDEHCVALYIAWVKISSKCSLLSVIITTGDSLTHSSPSSYLPHLALYYPHSLFFPLSVDCLIFCSFLLFPFLIHFTYFSSFVHPFLSTRIVPLRFQAGGHRKRPNLDLVWCVYFVLSVWLS